MRLKIRRIARRKRKEKSLSKSNQTMSPTLSNLKNKSLMIAASDSNNKINRSLSLKELVNLWQKYRIRRGSPKMSSELSIKSSRQEKITQPGSKSGLNHCGVPVASTAHRGVEGTNSSKKANAKSRKTSI